MYSKKKNFCQVTYYRFNTNNIVNENITLVENNLEENGNQPFFF